MTNDNLAETYFSLDFGLVNLSGKRPTEPGWPDHPITDPSLLNGRDIGLHHGYSKTCVLDIDHISARYALSLANIDLDKVLVANPYQISGAQNNPPKPLFRVPPGVKLSVKQLRWPDPDGQTDENGKVKNVTIFELRGGPGCQDVLPPSIHPDTGNAYTWVNGPPENREDIPFMPDALIRLWRDWDDEYEPLLKAGCPWLDPGPKPKTSRKYNGPPDPDFDVAIVQMRFNNRYSPGYILERNGYIPKGKKWLCPSSSTGIPGVIRLRDDLKIMSFHGSDPLSDGRPHDAYDCSVILEHDGDRSAAWHAGKDDLELKMDKTEGGHRADLVEKIPQGEQGGKPTHDELADRWIDDSNEKTVYGLGDWRRYKNGIWNVLPDLAAKREIKRIVVIAKSEGIRPNSALIASVADLAKFDIAVDDKLFDADIDYLVCANGSLHIPTRTVNEHDPDLYATSGVAYAYDPDAKAPHWDHFLRSTFDDDVSSFLQEFAGYCLTTDTGHEIAVWLYGMPGGGKSTFVLGVTTMLGQRAGLLGLADIERSRFALSNLPGKTLVVATEQPSMYLAATHTLNSMISGEAIPIDRKFKDPYDLIPRAKILWSMNGLPRINDPSNGLFRRVKVLTMPSIPESERDPRFKKEIEKEGTGILNWALDGLDKLRERGRFDIPELIKNATEDFKKTNDIPASFVADRCVKGKDANGRVYSVKSSKLYSAYRAWCQDTNHKAQSTTSIATDWKRLGFEQRRKNDGIYWEGIQLAL